MNAHRQPSVRLTHATIGTEMTSPAPTPALHKPVARPRSLRGNHSDDRLDACRPAAGFAHAEQEATGGERGDAGAERVQHCGGGPPAHDQRKAEARADAIDQPAGDGLHERVREQERGEDRCVAGVADAEVVAQRRREHRQDLPVDVADRRRREQQRDDRPADRTLVDLDLSRARSDSSGAPRSAASAGTRRSAAAGRCA